MKCSHIKDELIQYYYKELNPEKESHVKEHLNSCDTCRQAFDEIGRTLRLVDQKVGFEPTEEFWNSYLDKVYDKVDRGSFASRLLIDIFLEPKPVPVTVASILIFLMLASSSIYLVNKSSNYEQMQLAQNIDLFRDFDVIQDLEVLENMEFLQEADLGNEETL
ncbi:MAG: hypothetical protein ABH868_05830 [bacterium]